MRNITISPTLFGYIHKGEPIYVTLATRKNGHATDPAARLGAHAR